MRELIDKVFYCQQCECDFWATRTAKYCSPKCRTAAHRAKNKPALLHNMVLHSHPELIEQWNLVRDLSSYAEKLILDLYDEYGYDAARLAIVAGDAIHFNVPIKTEQAERIVDEAGIT